MFTRTLRMSAVVLTAALAITGVGATAADARPAKPGPVPNLAASATEPSIGTYDVSAHWDAAAHATSYQVSVIRAGTTLKSAKVTDLQWSTDVSATPGQQLTVSVRGLVGHFKGKTADKKIQLTDQIAPSASYTSSWDNNTGIATLTEVGLADDSALSGVTRVVDWGDGSAPVTYAPGDTITNAAHPYLLTASRYVPQVTLEDAATNTREVDAPAVVINDSEAPTGTFASRPATAWTQYTKVTVSQSALADNWTPADLISRNVDWGDGTTTDWAVGTSVKHVYQTAGTYTPAVTITDEAHNPATLQTSAVVVTADKVRPKVTLVRPRPRHSVKAWKTLHGKATDAGTGVKSVFVKAVEKRGKTWYAYNPATTTWVKAATQAKALAKSKAIVRTPNARHRWTAKLVGLRKGTLIVKVWATDHVKNRSVVLSRKASLTAR
jgi:PKD domain